MRKDFVVGAGATLTIAATDEAQTLPGLGVEAVSVDPTEDVRDLPERVGVVTYRDIVLGPGARLIVEGERSSALAIDRTPSPAARRQLISSRSWNDRRPTPATGQPARNGSGITPPTCQNHRCATVFETPAAAAASAITRPERTPAQNSR